MNSAPLRVLIAASGSGGHLLPAVFIARGFQRQAAGRPLEILFVGSGRPLEERIVGGAGFQRTVIAMSGVKGVGLIGLLRTVARLPGAMIATWKLLDTFKPSLIVGVGGYASVLPVLLGAVFNIPTWIHEAEISPGVANRFLARFATRISTAFERCDLAGEKVIHTGHPVRETIATVGARAPGTPPARLLVLGGSQGATAIDEALVALGPTLEKRGLTIWHQCRAEALQRVREGYAATGGTARVEPFIEDMAAAYTWSDLIISRAGAGAVMEIGAVNRPTIFVPFPSSQGNHQLHNARTLEARGKALIVEQGERFQERLHAAIATLLEQATYDRMLQQDAVRRSLTAADEIARGGIRLIDGRIDG